MNDQSDRDGEILKNLFSEVEAFLSTDRESSCADPMDPERLSKLLHLDREGGIEDPETLKHWVAQYFRYAVKTHHFGFNNRMWAGANISSIVGEIAAAVSQTDAGSYEAAPVSVLMEKYMIRQMLDLAGFSSGEGQMTTGSSNANMIAMMSARNLVSEHMKSTGLFGHGKLYAFVSSDAHYSLDKAVNILGIGLDQLVKIPVDDHGRMELAALQREMDRVIAGGGKPFFVAATMGTTVRGAYDPLPELVRLREKYKFWLHADGAWGGAAIFSDSLKSKYLRGLDEADSFTMDFHKMPGTSLICNVLLFNKRPGIMDFVCNVGDKSYLHRKEREGEEYNLGAYSLQCGRRVDSLKWFLDWKFYKKEGFAARIEKYHRLAELGERIVGETDELEMVVPRESFNLCFRYKADGDKNRFNELLRKELHRRGLTLVAQAYIRGEVSLRLLLTHKDMEEEQLRDFFGNVVLTGRDLSGLSQL
ncbi:MAG: hypothetical protein JXR86_10980 [Spirochaetales bacterium]|nr:hypothetical protein [Spirochaetales bacterium]